MGFRSAQKEINGESKLSKLGGKGSVGRGVRVQSASIGSNEDKGCAMSLMVVKKGCTHDTVKSESYKEGRRQ